jgi:tRNA(His) guanylyltransferase
LPDVRTPISGGNTTTDRTSSSEQGATEQLRGMSSSAKNELLFGQGVNFNDLPNWQKRGVGLYWEQFDKIGTNPVTGQSVVARRRRIKRDFDLPMKDEYGQFIAGLICSDKTGSGEA